jgi:pilus assembly protein CpaE
MTDRQQPCILLISIDGTFVNTVTPALHPRYRVIHCRPQQADVDRGIKSFQPDVCIVDVDDLKWDDNFHLELIENVTILTAAPVIVATYDLTTSLVVEALRAGARDVCEKAGSPADIRDVVENLLKRRHKGHGDRTARLITVHGARPGVGATTTALALGQAIARRLDEPDRVLFMDFSLPPAEGPDIMALSPRYYLVDAVQDVGRLDETFVENALARAADCPLYLMPLCQSLTEVEALETTDIVVLLSVLKSFFHTIVIDPNPGWRPELTQRFLIEADLPLLCVSQSVTAIHAGVALLQSLRSEAPDFAFHLAVTRHSALLCPTPDDMAGTLGAEGRLHVVENDRPFVEMARNLGTPLVRAHGANRFERSIQRLADALLPDLPRRRRRLSGGFGLKAMLTKPAPDAVPINAEASRG